MGNHAIPGARSMRAAGISAAAGAFAAYGHGSVSARGRAPAAGNFPETPEWNFVFVNHVTTNPFWVPTIYGIEDAAALLGLPEVQWTGSEVSDIGEMVNAFEAAIAGGANGIAVSLVDLEAFNEPVQAGAGRRDPRGVLQRRRAQRPHVLHRPGPLRIRLCDG